MERTIEIYTTPQCGFCKQLKERLEAVSMAYEAHDVTSDTDALSEMQQLSGGSMTVPITVLNKGLEDQEVAIGFETALKALGIDNGASESKEKETANLTCPNCSHKQEGEVPTDSCVPFYKCDGCNETIKAEGEDCCVFCSYADKPCPLKRGGCEHGACEVPKKA